MTYVMLTTFIGSSGIIKYMHSLNKNVTYENKIYKTPIKDFEMMMKTLQVKISKACQRVMKLLKLLLKKL